MGDDDRELSAAPDRWCEVAETTPSAISEEELRTLVRELLTGGRTQRSVAAESGVTQSLLSQWLKGKFPYHTSGIVEKLTRWNLNRQQSALLELAGAPTWVATPTGEDIANALKFAQYECSISLVYGGAGVGKTTALRRYEDASSNVWIVTSSPSRSSMAAALSDVAATLGMRGLSRRADDMSRDIMQRLGGTRGLLVVDEAQHLSVTALEELRAIHDGCHVGLCLSGNEAVYSKMTGGNRKAVFAQLFSRIGWRLSLRGPQEGDVESIVKAWRITGARELEFAMRIAMLPGGLRGLFQVLRQAGFVAQSSGGAIDLVLMRAAWRDLVGDS